MRRSPFLSHRELEMLTGHLSTLLGAGIGLIPALQVLADGGDRKTAGCLEQLMRDIEGGQSFSAALKRQPRNFGSGYRCVVENAEQTGCLGFAMNRLAATLERQSRLRNQVLQSLTYPCILLLFSLGMVLALVYGLVPMVLRVTVDAGVKPPVLTQFLIGLANPKVGLTCLTCLGLLALLLSRVARHPRWGPVLQEMLERHTPVGHFWVQVQLLSVLRQFSMMLETGTDLLKCILYSGRVGEDSLLLREAMFDIYEGVRSGESISDCMAGHPVFPQALTSMVAVSEEVGGTQGLIRRYCDLLETHLEAQLDALVSVLEPLLVGGLGIFVGFILVASFLPLYRLVTL